ncbi:MULTISPECIES: YceI family protein [unclassified Pantoea]|uniref:YceI family protein n=1 Tax=unclassified Pantoea TaxID=2630326 RepID=UPI0015D0816C|nr:MULTISPECIES: YceI family protein [unclassified Pantoea]NYS31936.1 YceI family protein [Pantoea sp. WMus005]
MIRTACLCTLFALFSPVLYAAPVTYAITPDKTSIGLSWRAFGHDFSQARLQGVTGMVTLNPEEDHDDRIEVNIPVGTLVASNSLLTWQLKSDLFFDAERYPQIHFVSSRVASLGDGNYRIFGVLTVKNVSRPVVMLASLDSGKTIDPASRALALHASTAISRSAFGMDRLVGVVDDRVNIALTITAQSR